MTDGNDNKPKAPLVAGLAYGKHAMSPIDWAMLPFKISADFMHSGMQMWNNHMAALTTMLDPKLLSDSTRMGHFYAIAKHYMPAALFGQSPQIVLAYMEANGITADTVREMEEDDLTILTLEAMGKFTTERGVLNDRKYNKKWGCSRLGG